MHLYVTSYTNFNTVYMLSQLPMVINRMDKQNWGYEDNRLVKLLAGKCWVVGGVCTARVAIVEKVRAYWSKYNYKYGRRKTKWKKVMTRAGGRKLTVGIAWCGNYWMTKGGTIHINILLTISDVLVSIG